MAAFVSPEQLGGPSKPPSRKEEQPDKKRRSTKACDACRKAKCKCAPALDTDGTPIEGPCQSCRANNQTCTYEASSKKRGPPKGYLEAVEQRLHRMEALLGGLIENEDPRAQALLGELIGDEDAQAVFRNDLRAAAAVGPDGQVRRSWQSPILNTPAGGSLSQRRQSDTKRARMTPQDENGPTSIHLPKPNASWYSTDPNGTAMDSTLGLSPGDSDSESEDAVTPGLSRSLPLPSPGLGLQQPSMSPQRRSKGLPSVSNGRGNASDVFAHQPVPSSSRLPVPSTVPHTSFVPSHGGGGETTQLSELADVVGQLSLNEVNEIRYHGRTSGLYLISESGRYKDFFWRFPSASVWPGTSTNFFNKSDEDILKAANAVDALPDQQTQDRLLEAYWTWVHPVLPILYRSTFMKQYRAGSIRGTPPALQGSESSVPTFLLLAIFALAARYVDSNDPNQRGWAAGDDYFLKADAILAQDDLGFSRLTTVQGMLLMAYREAGMGAMARSWALVGMAIRMAQDMGLFRDVDRWYMPAAAQLSYEEKQTRKRVWWGCVFLDRYISAFIGRPMAVHERDWDTAFPSESEPDEHDPWKSDVIEHTSAPYLKSHSISTFNRASSLAVHLGRVIIQLYAIRVRVIGQSSTALLSHLDQQLAKWYLSLPPHLQYTPGRAQPPAVLVLHANFYTTLLLLHRPFTPNRAAGSPPQAVPSHSIATTAANAIANIVTAFQDIYGLRRAAPMLSYYTFSAAVMHVYNLTYDPALAKSARDNLGKCMRALREMSQIWGAAWRSLEVLKGLAAVSKGEQLPVVPSYIPRGGTKRPYAESGRQSPVDNKPDINVPSPFGGDMGDFSFNLEDLFQPAQTGEPTTTAPPAPNPVFADLLDSFFVRDGGTSGFNELNAGVPVAASASPASLDSGSLHGFEAGPYTQAGVTAGAASMDEDWSAYLATLNSSAAPTPARSDVRSPI